MAGEEDAAGSVLEDTDADGAEDRADEAWTGKYMGLEAPSAAEDDRPKQSSYLSFTASFMSGRHLSVDGFGPLDPPPWTSVSDRIAANTARLRSEARQRDREQKDKLHAAITKAQSRPSGCPPIRPKSQEPESIESRAARRRSDSRQTTMERQQQVLQMSEKIRQREPLYRTEGVSAPRESLEQQVVERRRRLAEETRQRQQALWDTAKTGRSKSLMVGSSRPQSTPMARQLSEVALEKKMEAKALAREQWEKIRQIRESGYKRSAETFSPLFRKGRADATI